MHNLFNKEPMYYSFEVDFMLSILFSITGFLINWKLLKDIEEDDRRRCPGEAPSAIHYIMISFLKIQRALTLYYIWLNWFLNEEIFDLPEWLQYLLCYDQYLSNFSAIHCGFNSLVIASIRYMFIVHDERVMLFGKDKLKALFEHGSYVAPIALTCLAGFTMPMPENFQAPAQLICNALRHQSLNITYRDKKCTSVQYSPLLSFSHRYVPTEITTYLGICLKIIFVIVGANVVEGILYWKIFNKIKR